MGFIIHLRHCDRGGIEGDHHPVLLKRENPRSMIVDGPLEGCIEIGQNFMDVIGKLCDGPDLLRIGYTGKDVGDLKAIQQHLVLCPPQGRRPSNDQL